MNDQTPITLILDAAPSDPPISEPYFQTRLKAVGTALRARRIAHTEKTKMVEVKEEGVLYCTSPDPISISIGQYVISLAQFAGPVITGVFGAWIAARAGRKLRIKVGNVELEARSEEEIKGLMEMVTKLRAAQPPEDPQV